MIISIHVEKDFDKIQHHFLRKTLKKLQIKGMFLLILKVLYNKSIANLIVNGEVLKLFPLMSGTIQGCLLPPLLLNIVLQLLAKKIR
jgi:retron-type reverse transcriptase